MKKTKIAAALAVASAFVCPIALVGCDNDTNHEHTFSTAWEQTDDKLYHYHPATCEHTDQKGSYGKHEYDGDNDAACNVCGIEREIGGTVDPDKEVGTLSGTVTAYGKNLNGVTVAVGDDTTVSGATGKYSLGNVEIGDSVTVTFTKTGYRTESKTIAKTDWTDKKSTLDVDMRLEVEKATVSGTVKSGGSAVVGATVTLGELTPVTTGADGAYSFEVSSATAATLTLTVSHSLYETHSEEVSIAVGDTAIAKNVSLTAKTVAELGDASLVSLNAMTAIDAEDYNFNRPDRGGSGIDSWERSGSHEQANEGLLFHEAGQDIASGSKELKLFAYRRYTFDAVEQITVLARRFGDPTHNANLQGGGYPEVYILLVAEDGTVITPEEEPGKVVSTVDECDRLVFTFDEPITGNYVFAVGMTRGNRTAIDSVEFRGVEVNGTITGTIMQNDAALAGATVTFGDGDPVTTTSDGTFSIPVSVRKGGSDKITVSKDGVSMDIPFTADNFVSGTYNVGEKELKALPLPGITQEQLDALTTKTATDVTGDRSNANTEFSTWQSVGRDNGNAGEGWLLRDAGYAEQGTSELKVFMYRKLTFNNLKAIAIRARTFTNQNDVDAEHRNVHPEMILKLIDSDGNSININHNLAYVNTDSDDAYFYFTLDTAITGDYVLAIGMARGQRLALGGISYLAPDDIVVGNVTGTVKFDGEAVEGAVVSYALGYNVKGSVQTSTDGTFDLPVALLSDGTVTLTVESEAKNASKSVTVNASQFESNAVDVGEIVLSKIYMPGLTSDDIAALEKRTDTTFGHSNNGNGAIQRYWSKYGDVDWGHGEGACIQLSESNPVSYMYAKFNIDDAHSFMKLNARMFLRGHTVGSSEMEDQPTAIKVTVISDGVATVVSPVKAYRGSNDVSSTNIAGDNNELLINNDDSYTEGVYDLSAYSDKDVVIVIEAVYFDEINGKQTHNAINEIAFGNNADTAFGKPASNG